MAGGHRRESFTKSNFVPYFQRRIFPSYGKIKAWVRAGGALDGELSFLSCCCTARVMTTPCSLKHLQMAPQPHNELKFSIAILE